MVVVSNFSEYFFHIFSTSLDAVVFLLEISLARKGSNT